MKLYIKGLLFMGLLAGAACTDLETDLNAVYTELPDNPIVIDAQMNACYKDVHGWFGRDYTEGISNQGDELFACQYAGAYYDEGRVFDANAHMLHLDNWRTKFIDGSMSGISKCNEVIVQYGGPEHNDPGIAPVRAMRAYYTFWMMDVYGDSPIMDHILDTGEVYDRAPRADVARWIESELLEVLGQEGALSKANDASTYGKPNYWMAAALLAKLYLNWGVYTHDITTVGYDTPNEKLADCVKWCDEIIHSGIFSVGSGYRQKFFPTTGSGPHNTDFIYALDNDPETKGDGCATWARWFVCRKYTLCQPYMYGWDTVGKSLAGIYVLTPEALNRFSLPNDERNIMVEKGLQYQYDYNYNRTTTPVMMYADANFRNQLFQLEYVADFMFEDAEYFDFGSDALPAANATTRNDGTAFLNVRKGARLYKYPPREQDYTLWNMAQANDTPIFRYADILLMKAECIMRGANGNGDTFEGLINEVRACSGAPAVNVSAEAAAGTNYNGVSALSPQAVVLLDERSRELILEPWRRNDLIRFGQFEADWGQKNKYKVWDTDDHTKMDAVEGVDYHWVVRQDTKNVGFTDIKDPRRRLMPLHRETLESNLNWHQNPGYMGL